MFFFFFCFLSFAVAEKTQILFHLHDAGETNALLPIIRQLDAEYLTLSTGVSENLLKAIPQDRLRNYSQYPQTDLSGFFDLMGIPEQSTETCKRAILEALP